MKFMRSMGSTAAASSRGLGGAFERLAADTLNRLFAEEAMRITTLYVRFYRSFNFDFVRKANPDAQRLAWEEIDGAWFPLIRIALDPVITAVVGANESGKSHLIGAIKAALTGTAFDHRDFCRYSTLFSAEHGKRRVPDFGLGLELDDEDAEALAGLGIEQRAITFLRLNGTDNQVIDASNEPRTLDKKQLEMLEARLPRPFELKTGVAIPKSVSFETLIARETTALSSRRRRMTIMEKLRELTSAEDIRTGADQLAALLTPATSDAEAQLREASDALARTLLVDIAQIAPDAFADLERAVKSEEEGSASALVDSMNRSIATHLNISRWWSQDEDFELRIDVREHEVVFLVRDKTGISYSFDERSTGLRYFLGYYVQLRAHEGEKELPEVLLMDEPDAFLSNVGQQDLLRLFEHFARPEFPPRRDQVVYVTHSPFLINKNAAHRLRVLDKGSDEEGTRVIRDASHNHYEPIRSSVGGFVAETAFVGGSNLFVEGLADQVLLVAAIALLRKRGTTPALVPDLNAVTIVPCGSASHVPYMAYLARGRDEVKPPCVVLLDGDDPGRQAAERLKRSELDGRPIINSSYVINLEQWAKDTKFKTTASVPVRELEDLIPRSLMLAAARAYARRFMGLDDSASAELKSAAIASAVSAAGNRSWKGLEHAFAATFGGAQIDKVGFARELADLLERSRDGSAPRGVEALARNFGPLLRELAERLADARRSEVRRRRERQVKQLTKGFERDHPDTAPVYQAAQVLQAIERSLEDSVDDDEIRVRLNDLQRRYGLTLEGTDPVGNYPAFLEELRNLAYQARVAREREG